MVTTGVEMRLQVLRMHIDGLTNREIAKKIGISHPTVAKIINEIESGKSSIPKDIYSSLEDMADVAKVKKKFGLSDEEFENAFEVGLTVNNIGASKTDLLRFAEIYKQHPEDFPDIVKGSQWISSQEREEGVSADEIVKSVESLAKRRNQIQAENEALLVESGRIEEKVEGLNQQKKDLEDEVALAKYIRERIDGKYVEVREIVDTLNSPGPSGKNIQRIIKTIANATRTGIPPETMIRRGD